MRPAEVSTPSDITVEVKRSFDASGDLVWRAYTEPEFFTLWCLGPPGWSMPVCEMDVRPGGRYRWRWRNDEDGSEFGFVGEFREVVSRAKLVHTQLYDAGDMGDSMGEKESVVTIDFTEADGGTLAATTIEFASKEDRDTALSTGMTDGMEMSYTQLDNLLAE